MNNLAIWTKESNLKNISWSNFSTKFNEKNFKLLFRLKITTVLFIILKIVYKLSKK